MSEENKTTGLENIYLFFGLKDFESNPETIRKAIKNFEMNYGVVTDKLYKEDDERIKMPDHLKHSFSDWEKGTERAFIADNARKAYIYALILAGDQKNEARKAKYDEQLRASPELQQKYSKDNPYSRILGGNFMPNQDNEMPEHLSEFEQHYKGRYPTLSKFALADGYDEFGLQLIFNKFLTMYHRYQWELQKKKKLEEENNYVADTEKKLKALPEEKVDAESGALAVWQDPVEKLDKWDPPLLEYKPDETEAEDVQDEPLEGEWEEPEDRSQFKKKNEDDIEDAEWEEIVDDIKQDFTECAKHDSIYPPDGRNNKALFGLPMLFVNSFVDYGNTNLHVMSGIEGRHYMFNKHNSFSISGHLKVDSFLVNHTGKPSRRVAVSGEIEMKCNGAFFDGDVDARVRKPKHSQKIVQGPDGQPQRIVVEEQSYKKGLIEIDAGNEDVVINGDLLGKVRIKTTGNIKVIGNVTGNVIFDAAGDIEVLGSVKGRACLRAHGEVNIRGKKGITVKTSKNVSVGNDVLPDHIMEEIRANVRGVEPDTVSPEFEAEASAEENADTQEQQAKPGPAV